MKEEEEKEDDDEDDDDDNLHTATRSNQTIFCEIFIGKLLFSIFSYFWFRFMIFGWF